MRLEFFGVRGSTPVFGAEFARTGGHTSCLAVSRAGVLPTLVLDAGTGLQLLARRRFGAEPFVGTILLTHLHWDHVQGLPFFPPADREDARVTVVQPAQGDPVEVLRRAMSPPHFPIGPDGLRGEWVHAALEPGKHQIDGFDVFAREVVHKGGRAYGYRIGTDGGTFAYVPDAIDDNDEAIRELASDVDVLVRGAPFLASESERANLFGHGTIEHTVAVAREVHARRLVITHHSPVRTDDDVDRIAAMPGVDEVAREGLVVEI